MSFGVFLFCPLILSWSHLPASARSAVPAVSAVPLASPVPAAPAFADAAWAAAPVPLRATYTWTGSGSNDHWDNVANWSFPGGGWPDDCYDDAVIPSSVYGFAVELVTEQIDDLTIEGDAAFSSQTPAIETLTVDSLTLIGECEIQLSGARVRTQTCSN